MSVVDVCAFASWWDICQIFRNLINLRWCFSVNLQYKFFIFPKLNSPQTGNLIVTDHVP